MDDEDFYREVIRRAPRTTSLLGVEFNLDWQLDWPDAESVLVQDLDDAQRCATTRCCKQSSTTS